MPFYGSELSLKRAMTPLAGKKLVIIGCGAQGFNQGLNLRDSGLNVTYALRQEAIDEKRPSWVKATEAGFQVGTYEEMVPTPIWC